MDGHRAYKLYMAVKLHFTHPKFDIFKNKGHLKGTYERFFMRNDRSLFEQAGRLYNEREFVLFVASNMLYGLPNMMYNMEEAKTNYKVFIKRRQSITRLFEDDLDTIIKHKARYDFSGQSIPDVLQLYLSQRITPETMVILNQLDGIVDRMNQNSTTASLFNEELLRIEKGSKFVKYDPYKIVTPFNEFLEEFKQQ